MTDAPTIAPPTRPQQQAIKPVLLDKVYDDPDFVIDAIKRTSPHRNLYAAEGFDQGDFAPCFRAYWCPIAGETEDPALRSILYNPHFIAAAKIAYDCEIVRPARIVINLNVPSPAQPAHMDLPSFRGMGAHPTWLATLMGWSGLFQRWEVQIASGLAWFYNGENGAFRYWPDGPGKPVRSVEAPFWNNGLICDNEFTFHQACGTGRPDNYLPRGATGLDCSIGWNGTAWDIIDEGKVVTTYPFEDVRLTTLWKANVFKDQAAVDTFDQHNDDLDQAMIAGIFADDLRARGYRFDMPGDPLTDAAWKCLLLEAYPPPPTPADAERLIG